MTTSAFDSAAANSSARSGRASWHWQTVGDDVDVVPQSDGHPSHTGHLPSRWLLQRHLGGGRRPAKWWPWVAGCAPRLLLRSGSGRNKRHCNNAPLLRSDVVLDNRATSQIGTRARAMAFEPVRLRDPIHGIAIDEQSTPLAGWVAEFDQLHPHAPGRPRSCPRRNAAPWPKAEAHPRPGGGRHFAEPTEPATTNRLSSPSIFGVERPNVALWPSM